MQTMDHRKGYFHAVIAAASLSGYVIVNRYAYSHADVNAGIYVAFFLISAGVFAFIDSMFSSSFRSNLRLFIEAKSYRTTKCNPILFGTLTAMAFGLFAFAQQKTTATNASIIFAANMVPTAIFSWLILKRGMSRLQGVSMAVTLVGLYLAVVGFAPLSLHVGDVLLMGAAIMTGYTNAYMKTLMHNFSARDVGCVRLMTGAILFSIYLIAVHDLHGIEMQTFIFSVIGGFFFFATVYGIASAVEKIHATEAVTIAQLHILTTPVIALFLLDEKYRMTTLLGSIVMLLGVVSFSRLGHKRSVPQSF